MKKIIFMMATIITLSGVAPLRHTFASEETELSVVNDYETKWCQDASFILRNSLNAAYNSSTFEEEIFILKRAINKTLATLNPKFTYYLESTLLLGLKLEAVVGSPKDKALILRRNIDYALDDLSYLDNRFRRYSNQQEHIFYVSIVLERVVNEAYRAKTDIAEKMILNAGASSSIQILSESDWRRDPRNACAVRYLKEVLELDVVLYKRDLISDAIHSLNYGCRY